MNKKNKIVQLVFIVIGVTAIGYFLLKFSDIKQNLISQSPPPIDQNTVNPPSFKEGPYSEKYQQKLLAQLKGKGKLPKFEDFPATKFSDNKNIIVDISSDPIAREFRSAIRYGVAYNGINFAGKYSIAEWGCGTSCQSGVIVDADTGHVYPLPGPMVSGFEARKDNRLLIQNPLSMSGNWREWYRMLYWEWTGNRYKLIGVYKVDFAKKEIMEAREDYAYYSGWIK